MASMLKVEQWWDAADLEKMHRAATEGVFNQLAGMSAMKQDGDGMIFSLIMAKAQARIHDRVVKHVKEYYAANFEDDELDQIIAFSQSPVAHKMREMMPAAQTALLQRFMDGTIDVPAVIDEIAAEMGLEEMGLDDENPD